ncbi:MAG: hypothetical protein Q8Q62_16565 [Mesorhizobium sp.]|nr:hypothetical protein [Mesorhizobium sp.]
MEHIAALLLIVGCSQDLSSCHELPAPVSIYEKATECDAELPIALRQFDGFRPRVMATCVAVDPALEEQDAELVWDIGPDGRLTAAIEVPRMTVASIAGRRTAE